MPRFQRPLYHSYKNIKNSLLDTLAICSIFLSLPLYLFLSLSLSLSLSLVSLPLSLSLSHCIFLCRHFLYLLISIRISLTTLSLSLMSPALSLSLPIYLSHCISYIVYLL